MLWVVGAMGLLLGLRFGVPALLAASAVGAGLLLVLAPLADMTLNALVFKPCTLLAALQVGYLAGVTLVAGCWRVRTAPSRKWS